ncbi:putative membrane protein YphA (DoxX/SURF4 family) [Actinoalloteichus hoggarensis]|uniref:Putative oxidoreductase MhqP n=1 Tax=Actinoalloteichus hoggarensis TaxID=1470176 RepID=A0A221W8Q0_9PSEU|nr:DoxX family protein [Actinoalloteichus hoggarensis]ASO22382.1 Putative oxidoreductase MhqP [Actinoalloteichus hoggarensis]MBB5923195.1 putative membrane protein YphA (DoxX/SURF4 family) [Actinoalloteichus hoggarensis]
MTNSDDGLGGAAGPYGRRRTENHDHFGLDAAAARVAAGTGRAGPDQDYAPPQRVGRHAMVESHHGAERARRHEPEPDVDDYVEDRYSEAAGDPGGYPAGVDLGRHIDRNQDWDRDAGRGRGGAGHRDETRRHGEHGAREQSGWDEDDPDQDGDYLDQDRDWAGQRAATRPRDRDDLPAAESDDDDYYYDDEPAEPVDRAALVEPEPLDGRNRRPALPANAGTDVGLLLLRLVLGGVFLAHGAQKVFGLFGGPGIDGFAAYLTQSGFHQAELLAWVTGVTELAGGALVVLGLATPLAAAGLLAIMANVILLRFAEGFFLTADGGFEFEAVLAGLAAALIFAGPGRAALDNGRPWYRRPIITGVSCLVVAAGAGAAVYFLLR